MKKLFAWITKRNREKEQQLIIQADAFSTDVSQVRCFAADCFFNRLLSGECACELKTVDIDKSGRCLNFCDRAKTANFISGEQTK